MNCRAALLPDRPQMPTAAERFDSINARAVALYDRIETGSSVDDLKLRAKEIQNIAVIGAAYERRRERGEAINEGRDR